MFGLGTQEILIILAIALIVFGPKKLPEIGKAIGQGMRELRKASRDIMDTIERDDDEPEPKPAWTTDQVSSEPLDQVTDESTIPVPDETPVAQATLDEAPEPPVHEQDTQKETVHNAADSDRD